MRSQQISLINNPRVKTDLIVSDNSTDTCKLRLDQEIKFRDFYRATKECVCLIESFGHKSNPFDESNQGLVLELELNPYAVEKVLMESKLASSLNIGQVRLYQLLSQILENKSRKYFLFAANEFEEFCNQFEDQEEQQDLIDAALLYIEYESITLVFPSTVDFYRYLFCYCSLNNGVEQIAFKPEGFIYSIELKTPIEEPDGSLNSQLQTHLQHVKIEPSSTESEDKDQSKDYLLERKHLKDAQAFQIQQASLFPLSGLIREFIQKSIKYRWGNSLKLFGLRSIPVLALTIVLGFFAHKQIAIGQLRSTVYDTKGQIDSPTRLAALQKLVKLGESLKNIPLHNANLNSANLKSAKLNGAFLDHANLNNAFLDRINLNGANLYKANLKSAFLSGAFLNGTFLNSTNLKSANLNGAFLSGAFLERANLNSTELINANLNGADLISANLGSANLNGAKLMGANLDGANLNGAKLQSTNLYGVSLNNAEFGCIKDATNRTVCTNLTNAKNLTPQQVKQAKNWQQGIYDPEFRKKLGLAP